MARELSPCGTEAAYRRHLRRGEDPCAECLSGAAKRKAERRSEAAGGKLVALPPVSDAPLDRGAELRMMYGRLSAALGGASAQYVPALVREMRAVLVEIEKLGDSADESLESVMGEALRRIGG